jgi:hypothetical protein
VNAANAPGFGQNFERVPALSFWSFSTVDAKASGRVKFRVIMGNANEADAYCKLQELYADMSDSRIESMAENIDDLTEIAQQVLREEIAKRGLDAQGQEAAAPVEIARRSLQSELSDPVIPFHTPRHEADLFDSKENPVDPNEHGKVIPQLDPHAYDPVAIWIVTSPEKARQIVGILDSAGIEWYLGPDNVKKVEDFKGDFELGVEIKVMKFQARFAQDGLRRVVPREPDEESWDQEEFSISCPKCNSPDVIFLGLVEGDGKDTAAKAKNSWTCDACGHEWQDDGIEEKV